MSHHHFTTYERGKIEELYQIGYSSRRIASRLGCHHSSNARELKRLSTRHGYKAEEAQRDYQKKRLNSKPQGKRIEELCAVVIKKLKATWSPEQISNTVTKGDLSFKTIYNWIYAGNLDDISLNNLRRKGKRKTSQTAKFFARGTSICKRPKEVYSRKTFGHWALDTVVPCRGEKSTCFLLLLNVKPDDILLFSFRTELLSLWRALSNIFMGYYLKKLLLRQRLIAAASLLVLKTSNVIWVSLFISLILIVRTKEVAMNMPMVCLVSSFLKVPIFQKFLKINCLVLYSLLTTDQENVSLGFLLLKLFYTNCRF